MLDLRDLYAIPIAFSLTLWDAVPVFISVGLAVAILTRVVLSGRALRFAWSARERLAVEGMVYVILFQPALLAVIVASSAIGSSLYGPTAIEDRSLPSSPGAAMRTRAGELLVPLMLSCLAAAAIKIASPSIPDSFVVQVIVAMAGAILIGGRSGTSAIPAVAIAVHMGGLFPAAVWVLVSAGREVLTPHLGFKLKEIDAI